MSGCIPLHQFQRLLAEQLNPMERKALDAHLNTCVLCEEMLALLLNKSEEIVTAVDWHLLHGTPQTSTVELPNNFLGRLKAEPPLQLSAASGAPDGQAEPDIRFPGPPTPLGRLGQLESYHIQAELGRGAFGLVFKAHDEKLDSLVALKVLRPELATSTGDRSRFEGEARKAAAVRHDHVVAIYRVGSTSGFSLPYFVMEYIDGESLSDRLQRLGTLGPREAAEKARQTALGLAAAHACGLVHRDIKPSNILLERSSGRAKITDFGLARTFEVRTEKLTQSGGIVGTPPYMSPEQIMTPQRIDHRSDIYSLGIVLYEMLTGEPPFRGLTHLVLQQVVHEEPRPPRRLNDTIPRDLETICLHCLHKEPNQRYASSAALAEDLRRFLAQEPIEARPVRVWERVGKWVRRRPAVAALLALVFFVTSLGFGLVTWQWWQAEGARHDLARKAEEQEVKDYFHMIALAYRELSVQNRGRAEELLDECPQGRRGWEWHYLKRLCHTPPVALTIGQPVVMGEGFDLAFSPESRLLAIPSANNDIRVWDVTRRQVVLTLHGHGARVLAVAFSLDGRRLASTSMDGTVKLWDLPRSENRAATEAPVMAPTRTLAGHKDRVLGVVFNPDGSLLASTGNDRQVIIWDASTGNLLRKLKGQLIPNPYTSLAFSPDGRWLASGSENNKIKVWDVASGEDIFTLSGHARPILSVLFSSNGRRLISAGRDRKVMVWDLTAGEHGELTPRCVLSGLSMGVWCAALSPDGQRLAVGGPLSDGKVRVYDTATGQLRHELEGHIRVVSVAFSPDGKRIASAGLDKMVRLWDTATGQEVLALHGHADLVGRVLFSPDGQRLASAAADGRVLVWDASSYDESADRRILTIHENGGTIYGLTFTPDSRWLASAGSDHMVKLRDIETGQEVRVLPGHKGTVFGVAFGPGLGDKYHLLSGSNDQTIKLWDPLTGQVLFTGGKFAGMVRSVAFSPRGDIFATGSMRMLQLWDARDVRDIQPLGDPQRADAEHVECVVFSPNGKQLATAGSHRTVRLWNVGNRQLTPVHDYKGHSTKVFSVAFSPDGRLLASGDFSGQVIIWDTATGRQKCTLPQQSDCISGIAFSPDGRHLITASWKTIAVWDVQCRDEPVATLSQLAGTIWCIAFSPDGRHLAAAGGYKGKGEIKIWDWDKIPRDHRASP